jgi:prepilin-type N-terminal cleavage/methylation domain-containing protein
MAWADAPRRSEQGFSLVESVIAVAVLGIIVTAMVGGMATSIATSDIHRQQSTVNAVMVSAVETVKNAPYASCANGGDADTATYSTKTVLPAGANPWLPGAITTTVQYWNPQTSGWETSCHDTATNPLDTTNPPDGLGGPFPMQLVTILVTSPGNRASTSVGIVKRGP